MKQEVHHFSEMQDDVIPVFAFKGCFVDKMRMYCPNNPGFSGIDFKVLFQQ